MQSTTTPLQTAIVPPPPPNFEADRQQEPLSALPVFQVGISEDGEPVVWAADDKAFRVGMALVAMKRAASLLILARRAGLAAILAEGTWAAAPALDDMLNRAISLLAHGECISGTERKG